MLIIPVIDLSHGRVVHAIKGERNKYQPLESVLTSGSEPETILAAYFKLYPFKKIYIADLDAIQGTGDHFQLIADLARRYQTCKFWIDAGIEFIKNNHPLIIEKNIAPVLGSENKSNEKSFISLLKKNTETVLSLDFNYEHFPENSFLLSSPEHWPKNVILMMMHLVGTSAGIDQRRISQIQQLSLHSHIFVAGGIKNKSDLSQLKQSGVSGVLLATALHNGEITKEDLSSIS